MTSRQDVARGREIVERWCVLAEQRLEYLTDLFETGRWRRFHSEADFLENIREAKQAVETWRMLVTQEASPNNAAINVKWLDRPRAIPPRRELQLRDQVRPSHAVAAIRLDASEVGAVTTSRSMEESVEGMSPAQRIAEQVIQQSPKPPIDNSWQHALDPATIQERYPLLRLAL